MIIIGEKINGAIPSVGKAIAGRDGEFIQTLAKKQGDAGAEYIDVCAFVKNGEEETLKWLIDHVQEATDTPVSIDSPDAELCARAMSFCKKPGLINSVSGEARKLDAVFPAIAGTDWHVMALLCDENGIPKTAEKRLEVLDRVMERASEFSIAEERVFVDPLVEMLCTSERGALTILEVIGGIKERYPKVHISCAVSNVSYNLPYRKSINIAFTVMAMHAGMDCAVLDPLSRDLMGTVYAAEALMGRDYYCLKYIGAFRSGAFGPAEKQ